MDDQILTYAEIDARADSIASGLTAIGVGRGDKVATLATNRVELLELFFGLARLGTVQVPVNAYLKGGFLRHQLAHAGVTTLITDAAGREAVAPLRPELPELQKTVMLDAPIAGEVPYSELATADAAAPEVALDMADPIAIVYTSGTTGLPKGCVASHGYFWRSCRLLGEGLEVTDDDVIFGALPLFHVSALFASVGMPLVFGVPSYLRRAFSVSGFFAAAGRCAATVTAAVGPMAQALLATEPGPADRNHRLQKFMCAPLSLASQRALRERFGVEPWVDFYGQSECMPVTITPWSSHRRDPAGCGLPAPDLDVRVLDDDGRPVDGDAVGEICVRPKQPHAMFDGYYRLPAETREAFGSGFYHTGDYGRRLASGAIAFVDRRKDALRRRGENVSSIEIEASINTHPQILDSAVHAVPSDLGEDDIKACVVVAEGATLCAEDLFAFLKEQLPYFAVPRYVEIVGSLPRNAVGRVRKHELRQGGKTPGTWDFEAMGLTIASADRR
jgi:crotonobetaine/carnitine-CoA ligase